jgi:hypothetical protein
VASVGWEADADTPGEGVLEIEFHSGGVYRYVDVPEAEYKRLIQAASVGRHFRQYILGAYEEEYG